MIRHALPGGGTETIGLNSFPMQGSESLGLVLRGIWEKLWRAQEGCIFQEA